MRTKELRYVFNLRKSRKTGGLNICISITDFIDYNLGNWQNYSRLFYYVMQKQLNYSIKNEKFSDKT